MQLNKTMQAIETKYFLFYWLPVCAYAGMIFYFSSMSVVPTTEVTPEIPDWALHMAEYAVLGLLLLRAFGKSAKLTLREKAAILAVVVAAAYGVTDEIHQYFVPGREMSAVDAFADFLGSFVAVALIAIVSAKFAKLGAKFNAKLDSKLGAKFKLSKLHF